MDNPTKLPGLPNGAADPCVHCGFCLPTCASYRVLGNGLTSRSIHTLRAIEAGELELDATVASHLIPLGCMLCSACPSGFGMTADRECTSKLFGSGQRNLWQATFERC